MNMRGFAATISGMTSLSSISCAHVLDTCTLTQGSLKSNRLQNPTKSGTNHDS